MLEFDENMQEAVGIWTLEAIDAYGNVVWSQSKKNLITNNGKGLTLDRLFGLSAATNITGMAIGTSSSTAAVGDTTITGAVFKAFDATPTRAGLTVTVNTTYSTAEGNINIQEVGLLTASGGTLFNRLAPVGPFNKTTAVSLRIQVQITQS